MQHEDEDRGQLDQLKGKATENLGQVTGDRRTEADGKLDQAKGQDKVGIADIRDRFDERSERR